MAINSLFLSHRHPNARGTTLGGERRKREKEKKKKKHLFIKHPTLTRVGAPGAPRAVPSFRNPFRRHHLLDICAFVLRTLKCFSAVPLLWQNPAVAKPPRAREELIFAPYLSSDEEMVAVCVCHAEELFSSF